jgi:hypothetical protein
MLFSAFPLLSRRVGVNGVHALDRAAGVLMDRPLRSAADKDYEAADPKDQHGRDDDVV